MKVKMLLVAVVMLGAVGFAATQEPVTGYGNDLNGPLSNDLKKEFKAFNLAWMKGSAKNLAPADCFNRALHDPYMTRTTAVMLCSGAKNMTPIDCVNRVHQQDPDMNRGEAVKLCSQRRVR